jgi:hypothetical protein
MTTLIEIYNSWSNNQYGKKMYYEDDDDGINEAIVTFKEIIQKEIMTTKTRVEDMRGSLFIQRIGVDFDKPENIYCVEDFIDEEEKLPDLLFECLTEDDAICPDLANIAADYLEVEATFPHIINQDKVPFYS